VTFVGQEHVIDVCTKEEHLKNQKI